MFSTLAKITPDVLISWSLRMLMLTSVGYFAAGADWLGVAFALVCLSVSLIPPMVNHSYKTNLPWELDFWLTLWLALSVAGSLGLYDALHWWDNLLHLGGTAVLAYLAFVVIYALNFTGKVRLSIPLMGFFTFLTAMAFGALWEILEFWIWRVTGSDTLAMQGSIINGFWDTFADLQLDLLGGLLVAGGSMWYVGRQRHLTLRRWMEPFFTVFGEQLRQARTRARRVKSRVQKKLQLASQKPQKTSKKSKTPKKRTK
jgi:hypothetical protein